MRAGAKAKDDPPDACARDLSGDGQVGQADLDIVLANWADALPG